MLKFVRNVKNNWTYNNFHGLISQEWIDGRYWSPTLICHANQSNGYLHNIISELYWSHVVTSYKVDCIDNYRNIPDLKQRNIHEQGNPAMISQFWNLQTPSRVGTSPKANPSDPLVRYRLKFSQAHWCYNDKANESIAFMLWKIVVITHPILSWKILSDIILLRWHLQVTHISLAILPP